MIILICFPYCILQLRVVSNEAFAMLNKIHDEKLANIARKSEEDDKEVFNVIYPQ